MRFGAWRVHDSVQSHAVPHLNLGKMRYSHKIEKLGRGNIVARAAQWCEAATIFIANAIEPRFARSSVTLNSFEPPETQPVRSSSLFLLWAPRLRDAGQVLSLQAVAHLIRPKTFQTNQRLVQTRQVIARHLAHRLD